MFATASLCTIAVPSELIEPVRVVRQRVNLSRSRSILEAFDWEAVR
jgi:hypothetical protein